ncbi:MAG: response regulator [Nitrospiraceae bacterium]|nr:response regulator [Nitrospiraceae bacterium]
MTIADSVCGLCRQRPPEGADAALGKRNYDKDAFPRGCETILVVEDDGAVRDIAVQILELHGYKVIAAADGAGALALCESGRDCLHLIVVDVMLPDMSGRSLAGLLKSACGAPEVLFMSGYTDDVVMQEGMIEQGASFIAKPFVLATFLQKVREVLDGRTAILPGEPMIPQGSGEAGTSCARKLIQQSCSRHEK